MKQRAFYIALAAAVFVIVGFGVPRLIEWRENSRYPSEFAPEDEEFLNCDRITWDHRYTDYYCGKPQEYYRDLDNGGLRDYWAEERFE